MLLVGFVVLYLPAFGLFQWMIYRVNSSCRSTGEFPIRFFGEAGRLGREYKDLYPKSLLYQFTVTCAVACLIVAASFAGFRVWEYATGR
jgi:hypothetical protein